jgi:hydroxyacyl-ACP dehydratase HTD2-like protein with hotdog domain
MSTPTIAWDAVQEGDELPALVKHPSPMQLFMFSASTWNRHLIHYSTEFAIGDGLKNVAVHRALIGGFLAQMLSEWLGPAGAIKSISWSVRGSAAIDKPLTLRGKVVEKRRDGDELLLGCEIWAENHEGESIAPGTALVALQA